MYYKQHKGELLIHKSTEMPKWVKWVHHVTGLMHCAECLMLDGCWFLFEKVPIWPHHEKCHCTLEAIDCLVVMMNGFFCQRLDGQTRWRTEAKYTL